jgi:MtfA peptidase
VNPGEFFAVATEVFFDRPLELAAETPELYAVLRDFYRQDPARRASRPPRP